MDNNVISYYLFEHLPFTLALIAHFLGDFHFQSQQLANQKKLNFKALLTHLLWVGLPLLMIVIIFPFRINSFFFKVWLAHFAIDFIKYFLTKKGFLKPLWEKYVFLIDQILHLAAIFLIYDQYAYTAAVLDAPKAEYPAFPIFNILLLLVLITKPVNIVFKLFFSKYQPKVGEEAPKTKAGAGALIGQLERLTMAIFLIWGQFAAIGLVFTAKSIARFDRISKDQGFAEYYLIGSLFSIISVLLLYALLILY